MGLEWARLLSPLAVRRGYRLTSNSYLFSQVAGRVAKAPLAQLRQFSAPAMADSEVQALFSLWNDALATLDPDTVAKRYAKETILLPTVSDTPRKDYDSIHAYFVDFLQKKPQGTILDSKVIKGDG